MSQSNDGQQNSNDGQQNVSRQSRRDRENNSVSKPSTTRPAGSAVSDIQQSNRILSCFPFRPSRRSPASFFYGCDQRAALSPTSPTVPLNRSILQQGSRHSLYTPYPKRKKSTTFIYTEADLIRDTLAQVLKFLNLQAPYLPNIVVDFLPMYAWSSEFQNSEMNVKLSHSNTISCNERCLFGVVLGPELNPLTDHTISLELVDGIEFGVGVATKENVSKDAKRDFMCEIGGWGYYNYKTKFQGTKPKYPAGWYSQEHECIKKLPENNIIYKNDVLTVSITREGILPVETEEKRRDAEELYSSPRPGNGLFTVRYYKNGVKMAHEFLHIPGPLQICLNYYFMSSTIRILSDYRISRSVLTAGLVRGK